MSALNPKPVKMELGGKEYTILFTLNAIDEIQDSTGLSLYDAVHSVVDAADGRLDDDTRANLRKVTAAITGMTEKEAGDAIDMTNYTFVAIQILRAYGLSLPEPDEEDDSPNVEGGQTNP